MYSVKSYWLKKLMHAYKLYVPTTCNLHFTWSSACNQIFLWHNCSTELMASFEQSYTPSPKAVEIDHTFDVKEWMTEASTTLHNISNPHAFKFTKAPSGKVVMQYKNWGSDKKECWKPDNPDPEQWLSMLKVSCISCFKIMTIIVKQQSYFDIHPMLPMLIEAIIIQGF